MKKIGDVLKKWNVCFNNVLSKETTHWVRCHSITIILIKIGLYVLGNALTIMHYLM